MKKVLAWAVALALVLSSFTMAFADQAKTSADFKDASSINYTEAVDVMVATGVINGYPDGTFGPQKTVKRSEMAKMISVMLNGGTDIGDQYKDACTFADSKSHWAAGYIAYCAAQHIIDGRSASVFDPEKEVTGTEVAKMALTSLGYDSKIQGYVGENWAANVLKDANKIDLFDGLNSDFVPGNPCSREAAAQILFNALKATKVEYENGTSVSVGGDVSVTVNSKIQDVTKPASKDQQDEGQDGHGTIQLWEDVFGKDLTKQTAAGDDFGRPAHTWFDADDEEIGTYGDDADKTFVTEEQFDNIAAAVKDYNEDYKVTANTSVKMNGVDYNGQKVPAGTTVEITKNGNNVTMVVAYYYELAEITGVDTDVSSKDAKDDVEAYLDLDGVTFDAAKVKNTDIVGYDAKTYVEDAYVAVVWNTEKKKVIDSYVPKKVSGELTKTSKDSVYVDGTAYVTSMKDKTAPYTTGDCAVGDDVDLYVDNNNIALGTVLVDSEDNTLYGVLTDISINGGGSIKEDNSSLSKATVTIFTADGAEKDFTFSSDAKDALDAKEGADATVKTNIEEAKAALLDAKDGVMIAYTLDEDNNLDTMTVKYSGTADKKSMNSKGIFDGTLVNEDIVIFAYDTDEEEWTILGYKDLQDAEENSVSGPYFLNEDKEMAALWAKDGLIEATSDTLGFYVDSAEYTVKDGSKTKTYYEVTLLVDGKEVTYDTIKGIGGDYKLNNPAVGTLVIASINGDNEIEEIAELTEENGLVVGPTKDKFEENEKAIAYATDFTKLLDAKNKNLSFETDKWVGTSGAQAYKLSYNEDGELEMAAYTGSYKADGAAKLYQFDEESDAWDVVVYMTPADYDND